MKRKSAATLAEKRNVDGYRCKWCGIELDEDKDDKYVCSMCEKNRSWVLNMIRRSDKMFKYVSRIEEREKPEREARIKAEKLKKQTPVVELERSDDRIDKIEAMLSNLINALGGIK